jgi:hypothetical protein
MLTIVYASYGTAMGHRQETLATAGRRTERGRRPGVAMCLRRATAAMVALFGRRSRRDGIGPVAFGVPATGVLAVTR